MFLKASSSCLLPFLAIFVQSLATFSKDRILFQNVRTVSRGGGPWRFCPLSQGGGREEFNLFCTESNIFHAAKTTWESIIDIISILSSTQRGLNCFKRSVNLDNREIKGPKILLKLAHFLLVFLCLVFKQLCVWGGFLIHSPPNFDFFIVGETVQAITVIKHRAITYVLHTAMVWHDSPVQNSEIVLYCKLMWWKKVVAVREKSPRCYHYFTESDDADL